MVDDTGLKIVDLMPDTVACMGVCSITQVA